MAALSGLLDRTPTPSGESPSSYAGLNFSALAKPMGGDQSWVQMNSIKPGQSVGKAASSPLYRNANAAPILSGLYGSLGKTSPTFNVTQKNAGIGAGINTLTAGAQANANQANQTIADFTKQYMATKPQAQAFGQQEIDSVSQNFGTGPGSVKGELERLLKQREAATRSVTQQALSRAARDNSSYRLANGHGSGADALYAGKLADITSQAGLQNSDIARDNFLYQRQAQNGSLGARNKIMDSLLQRDLMPVQAGQQLLGGSANLFGGLAGLNNQNNIYDYQTADQQFQGKLANLGGLMNLENANTYTPLQQQQNEYAGLQTGFNQQQLLADQARWNQNQPLVNAQNTYNQQLGNQALQDQSLIDQKARPINLNQRLFGLDQTANQLQNQQAQQPFMNQQQAYANQQAQQQFQNQKFYDQQSQQRFNNSQAAWNQNQPALQQIAELQRQQEAMRLQQQLMDQYNNQYGGLAGYSSGIPWGQP